VIGHGRSPEGRGWGARIDQAATVIRMWNWHWQDSRDYGAAYHIGLLETHRKVLKQWREHNRATPERGWIASKLECSFLDMNMLPADCLVINQRQWTLSSDGRACHGRGTGPDGVWELTRGGIAACFAITHAPHGATIVLVGFDIIRGGIALPVDGAFSPAYQASGGFWGLDGYAEGVTKEGNHDYQAERRLIELLAARKGACRVVFAQDEWR